MRKFVITEAELKKYEGLFFLDDGAKEDFKRIRSRELEIEEKEFEEYV